MAGSVGARPGPHLEVLLTPAEHGAMVVGEVSAGLRRRRASLPLADLADSRTRDLWAELDDAEAFYPLRRTRQLATAHADHIAQLSRASTLVLVGGVDVAAVTTLAEGLDRHGGLGEVVAVGPVGPRVADTCEPLREALPSIEVRGIVAHPLRQLDQIEVARPALLVVSGPVMGRLGGRARAAFFAHLYHATRRGDTVLIGVDLTHDRDRAVAAFDDPHGHHDERARNALAVLVREFGARLDPDGWESVVVWDEHHGAVEVALRASTRQHVEIPSIGIDRWFAPGEVIELERNTIFLRNGIDAQLALAGLQVHHWWTSDEGDYALALASP